MAIQPMVMQLMAIVLLSTAISDEISHRTLAVLMSTPITIATASARLITNPLTEAVTAFA